MSQNPPAVVIAASFVLVVGLLFVVAGIALVSLPSALVVGGLVLAGFGLAALRGTKP